MNRVARGFAAFLLLFAFTLPVLATETKVDINKASVEELDRLPGIGPALAQRIVEFRKQNGSFHKVEDLLNVRGIGPKSFEPLRDKVTVGEPSRSDATKTDATRSAHNEPGK
jgi:competence ComEA-like helix-hairpin-helix protein